MKPRVILVNFEFPPIAGPGIWRVFALSRDLDALGFRVTVICSDRSTWHDLRDPTLCRELPSTVRVVRLHAPLLADWQAALQRRLQSSRTAVTRAGWQRARDWLKRLVPDPAVAWGWRATQAVRRELRSSRDPAVVITSGPAHITQWVGYAAARGPQVRWIMDYRDLWTSDPTHVHPGPYQARLLRVLERRCLRACHAVVSVAPSWLADLREIAGDDAAVTRKMHVIRNGHDLDATRVEQWLPRCRAQGPLRVHFSGTLQVGTRDTARVLFAAVAALRARRPELPPPALTFTGIPPRLRDVPRQLGIDECVSDLGYRPQAEALALAARADILLVLVDGKGPGRDGIIPAKTYESMALGRHVLAIVPPGSDVRRLLHDYGKASVCSESSEDVSSTLEALCERVRDDPASFDSDAARRLQWMDGLSRPAAAREFADLIGRVIAP